jgi:hypothetical protein
VRVVQRAEDRVAGQARRAWPPGRTLAARVPLVIAAIVLVVPGSVMAAEPAPTLQAPSGPAVAPAGEDRLSELEERVQQLDTEVQRLIVERDRLLDVVSHIDELSGVLEADRLLLIELRKEIPAARDEAEAYLERLRMLAQRSDPARLGPLTDRVLDAAPAWLDWRDTTYATQAEASAAYISTGATAFDEKMAEFRDAILLSVATRLDGLLNVLDRAR